MQDITALFHGLRGEREHFMPFIFPGVVEVDGDTATARSLCQEVASGGGKHYRTNGVWTDTFRRSEAEWVSSRRDYRYLWLDFSPFSGDVFWGGENAA